MYSQIKKQSISRWSRGFTMVEIMSVIAVVAILAAIAIPRYTQSIIKTNRTALETGMTQIAQKLANYKLVNNSYSVTLTTIYGGSVYPATGTALYDLALDTTTVAGAWTLTATPKSGTKQDGDGVVMLNDQGWRCWTKSATTCTLSATSKW